MLGRLFLLLVLLPLVEIALLVWLASKTSALLVVALVLGAGVLGVALARRQGMRALERVSAASRAGQVPNDALFDAALILVAGVLLVLPGFLTDVVALGLLFPRSRRAVKALLRHRFAGRFVGRTFTSYGSPMGHDEIIDVKLIEPAASNLENSGHQT